MATRRRSAQEAEASASVPGPRVVIVGGGMGGVQAAKTLAKAPVEITLVSARNYYLFQPLIYEVANALLQPEDIAPSIRGLLRKRPNVHFRLGAATSDVAWCGVFTRLFLRWRLSA